MREAHRQGVKRGLTDDSLAFYDALEVNDRAVKVLGDETLRLIAHEFFAAVRANVTIDWAVKETAREDPDHRAVVAPEARLPARRSREGDANGAGAGGVALSQRGGLIVNQVSGPISY
jgi:hypothetical protein